MAHATPQPRKKFERAGPFLLIIAASLAVVMSAFAIALGVQVHKLKAELADTHKQLDQAKADAASSRDELEKTKTALNNTQGDLTKAKAQVQTDQQVAKQASDQAQAELAKAKASSTELLAQLNGEKGRSGKLQSDLDRATAASAQLVEQLNQAKIQSGDLQARLDKAQSDIAALQPLLQRAGHMPVTTSVEKISGHNFTLHITNLYPQPVSVDVAVNGSNKPRSQHAVIGGNATQNIERLSAGDNVQITSDGFDPVKLTVQ